jgi:SAM-dependent methyltransferase
VFTKTARYYDAIYAWKDYEGEASRLHDAIQQRRPGARTLLDVACGTGKHLELLRAHYEVEGIDLDPKMIRIARERLGETAPLHVGDMSQFDLGRTFDVVTCLFSSVAYTVTVERLDRAVANLARHAAADGLLLVEPWFTPDAWTPRQLHAIFVDEPDLKVARISVSPELSDPLTMRFEYLVATPDGVEHLTEDHVVGMFTHEQYVDAFRRAGLAVERDPEGLMGRGLYIAVRPVVS